MPTVPSDPSSEPSPVTGNEPPRTAGHEPPRTAGHEQSHATGNEPSHASEAEPFRLTRAESLVTIETERFLASETEASRTADRRRRTIRTALITGAATTAYYATPDLIRSRTGRGWAKAALATGVLAVSAQRMHADFTEGRDSEQPGAGEEIARVWQHLSIPERVGITAVTAGLTAAQIGFIVVAERWVFRRGERRAAAGRRFAHSGPALLYGAAAAALEIAADVIPAPEERTDILTD